MMTATVQYTYAPTGGAPEKLASPLAISRDGEFVAFNSYSATDPKVRHYVRLLAVNS